MAEPVRRLEQVFFERLVLVRSGGESIRRSMAASSFYAAVEAVRAKKNGGFGTVKAADVYMGVSNELLDDGFFSLLSSISA